MAEKMRTRFWLAPRREEYVSVSWLRERIEERARELGEQAGYASAEDDGESLLCIEGGETELRRFLRLLNPDPTEEK